MPKKLDVTVEQLRSIYGQLYDALEEKAELHLPKENEDGSDHVRREVQLQLQEFLSQVMEMASSSLRVVNVDEGDSKDKLSVKDLIMKSQEKYVEPFDLELNERVRQTYQEWEDQTVKVAQLRKNGPQQVNDAYRSAKDQFLLQLDAKIDQLQSSETEASEVDRPHSDPEHDKFWEDIAAQYEQSLSDLNEAQTRIPQTRSDLNKVKNLVAYLETQLD